MKREAIVLFFFQFFVGLLSSSYYQNTESIFPFSVVEENHLLGLYRFDQSLRNAVLDNDTEEMYVLYFFHPLLQFLIISNCRIFS